MYTFAMLEEGNLAAQLNFTARVWQLQRPDLPRGHERVGVRLPQ